MYVVNDYSFKVKIGIELVLKFTVRTRSQGRIYGCVLMTWAAKNQASHHLILDIDANPARIKADGPTDPAIKQVK